MPNSSRRPKAEGRTEMLVRTNTSIAASGARDMGRTEVMNEADTTVVDQRSAVRTETTDSEILIAGVADEDCDSDVSTITNPLMQRGSGYSGMVLGDVAPFMERNRGNVASTLDGEWRGEVLQSQQATQAISSSSREQLQQTAEERWNASLENKIGQIRRQFHEQEKMLEREIVKLEQSYELDIKQLENEENDDNNPLAGSRELQSDYQPTECGDDGQESRDCPSQQARW